MTLWPELIELLQASIFTLAQAFGGNVGAGIVCFSLAARLAMLPLTIYLARRARKHRELMRKLQPELDALRERLRRKPERLAQETMKVFERHDARPVDMGGLLGGLAQMPVIFALFSAVRGSLTGGGRFAWIADIARPDTGLAVLVAALTYVSMRLQPDLPEQGRVLMTVLPTVMALMFLWRMAAGIGLYWGASTAVSLVQSAILTYKRF